VRIAIPFGSLLLVSALLTPLSVRADIISIPPDFAAQPFGNPNTATYGQTFALPAGDGVLTSWTFSLEETSSAYPIQFGVGLWDTANSRMAAAPFYLSSPIDTVVGDAAYTFLPNLTLTPGQEYVAFLTITNTPGVGTSQMPLAGNNLYTGGSFFFLNNGTDPSLWTTQGWQTFTDSDAAFTAQFDPATPVDGAIPEPGTLTLFGTGALGMIASLRRKFAR
jgi:hypothetical protein